MAADKIALGSTDSICRLMTDLMVAQLFVALAEAGINATWCNQIGL